MSNASSFFAPKLTTLIAFAMKNRRPPIRAIFRNVGRTGLELMPVSLFVLLIREDKLKPWVSKHFHLNTQELAQKQLKAIKAAIFV
jgi:hypothetical protein